MSLASATEPARNTGWGRELAVAVAWGGAIFAVTLLPYLFAYATTPPAKVFNGFFFIADDAATYISKMREGAEGAWGWTDRYITTPVPQPVLLFMFYILWGKLAALLHLPLLVAYHVARLSGAIALVYASRALARRVLPPASRGIGVILALVGAGAGYLLLLLGSVIGQNAVFGTRLEALDLHLPELSALYSVLAIPHFAWAAALMAISLVQLMAIARAGKRNAMVRPALLSAAALLGLCLIHPQMLFVLAPLAATYLMLVRSPLDAWVATAVPFLVCVPLLLYFLRVLGSDQVVVEWSRQWKHQAPGLINFAFGLGLPLALALYALGRGVFRGNPELALMGAWLVLVVALLYFPNPVNIQRRLVDGIFLPVAMLAAVAVKVLGESLRGPRARRRLTFTVAAASSVTSLLVLAIGFRFGATREPIIYLDAGEVSAIHWLANQHRQGLPPGVLSEGETGLYIPELAGDRVYVGHYSETIDYQRRARLARDAIATGGAGLATFMRTNDVTFLMVGPRERRLGVGEIGPELQRVYNAGNVELYRLRPSATSP